jgi:hypothetical protein
MPAAPTCDYLLCHARYPAMKKYSLIKSCSIFGRKRLGLHFSRSECGRYEAKRQAFQEKAVPFNSCCCTQCCLRSHATFVGGQAYATDQLAEGQDDVIADAARRWPGPNLNAFNICYHATHSGTNPKQVASILKLIAQRLKSRGAKIVVTPLGDICTPSLPNVPARDAYVEIAGVYRL